MAGTSGVYYIPTILSISAIWSSKDPAFIFSMELASANREPSLFAVAKLLETALVNLDRVDVVWRPITNHLLVVCQHPHLRMRQVN